MLSFGVGACGFAAVAAYDIAQVRHRRRLALVSAIAGYLCLAASLTVVIVSYSPAKDSFILLLLKILFAAGFFVLLLYSVLIEIPLALRRSRPSPAQARKVISSGTYGIVRHPGFLWFALMWGAIILIYLNPVVTRVGLGLVSLDFLLIAAEDLVFFPRIFSDYEEYRKRIPFIVPRFRMR